MGIVSIDREKALGAVRELMGDREVHPRQVAVLDRAIDAAECHLATDGRSASEVAQELMEIINAQIAILAQLDALSGDGQTRH